MLLSTLIAAIPLLTAYSGEADYKVLTEGVKDIGSPGIPGPIAVVGKDAFAVVWAQSGGALQPVVSASRFGTGKVVGFGHGGYFNKESLDKDAGRLLSNALSWSKKSRGNGVAVLGVSADVDGWLKTKSLEPVRIRVEDLNGNLSSFTNLIADAHEPITPQQAESVRGFVTNGGGLIVTGLAWGWLQLNPGNTLRKDFTWNTALEPMGLSFADGYSDRVVQVPVDGWAIARNLNALEALQRLEAGSKESAKGDTPLVLSAYRAVPEGSAFIKAVKDVAAKAAYDPPAEKKPIGLDQPLARLSIAVQAEEMHSAPPEAIKAAKGADIYPGQPDGTLISTDVEINFSIPGWRSTGLYAPAGKVVTVRGNNLPDGTKIQVGSHTDQLWDLDKWQRYPEIVIEKPFISGEAKIASPFGGLIYIVAPRAVDNVQRLSFQNVAPAPRFVLGKTTNEEWLSRVRDLPGPWAELETDKIVLTVPSSAIRKLEDPERLMKFWNTTADLYAELGTRPLPRRPERIVSDVQISAGYMHSGYPIMTWLDAAVFGTDYEKLTTDGSWGHWHELGHNNQQEAWTFEGTGEVTNNLFTVFAMERLAKKGIWDRVGPLEPKVKAFIAEGAPFAKWKDDPFLALYMYMQLVDAFGWDSLKKVFADYRDTPRNQLPRSDQEKRDQWMVRYSRAIGKNLGPFFQKWGVPTTQAARDSIASLPAWMPPGW